MTLITAKNAGSIKRRACAAHDLNAVDQIDIERKFRFRRRLLIHVVVDPVSAAQLNAPESRSNPPLMMGAAKSPR
jgi:hypothetical protein